jgi:phospholipid N-methyltransferase
VELHVELAQYLRERFPMIEVRAAAAHEVLREAQRDSEAAVLVSSLPFRSLPQRLRSRSSVAIERFLIERPASRLVQYTYLPWEPFHLRFGESLRWRQLESVWRNVPPAWVWELSSSHGESGRSQTLPGSTRLGRTGAVDGGNTRTDANEPGNKNAGLGPTDGM